MIFESGEELGLYRYLLTMLDGLESESAGRVCVMMTAMDVGSLPPALVRSGRIELWLETRLPDDAARGAILRAQLARPARRRIGAVDRGAGSPPDRVASPAPTSSGWSRTARCCSPTTGRSACRSKPLRSISWLLPRP